LRHRDEVEGGQTARAARGAARRPDSNRSFLSLPARTRP
jgi:hypothetical protein